MNKLERKRHYDKTFADRIRRQKEDLEYKLALLKARKEDENRTSHVITRGREDSVALLLHNYRRGMSQQKLVSIWGKQFVNAVLNSAAASEAEAAAPSTC